MGAQRSNFTPASNLQSISPELRCHLEADTPVADPPHECAPPPSHWSSHNQGNCRHATRCNSVPTPKRGELVEAREVLAAGEDPSSASRPDDELLAPTDVALEDSPPPAAPGSAEALRRQAWARMLRKVFEVEPPRARSPTGTRSGRGGRARSPRSRPPAACRERCARGGAGGRTEPEASSSRTRTGATPPPETARAGRAVTTGTARPRAQPTGSVTAGPYGREDHRHRLYSSRSTSRNTTRASPTPRSAATPGRDVLRNRGSGARPPGCGEAGRAPQETRGQSRRPLCRLRLRSEAQFSERMQSNDHADVPVLDQDLLICRHRIVRGHRGGRARPFERCRKSTAHVSRRGLVVTPTCVRLEVPPGHPLETSPGHLPGQAGAISLHLFARRCSEGVHGPRRSAVAKPSIARIRCERAQCAAGTCNERREEWSARSDSNRRGSPSLRYGATRRNRPVLVRGCCQHPLRPPHRLRLAEGYPR